MKKSILILLLLMVSMMIPVIGSYTKGINNVVIINRDKSFKKEKSFILKTLTVYNPTTKQCDSTPLITASNKKINVHKLYKKELRWIALSRNLLKRWKGEFNYGDTVLVTSGDKAIDGLWVIHDTLNKRYKDRGDLLFDSRIRKLGKWKNVKISKPV